MAGNSQRRGAVRKPGSKKGARVGTGGHGRKALEGKGPTPKATERVGHPAARRAAAAAKREQTKPRRGRPAGSARARGSEIVVGRNAVVEALRAGVPARSLHVASSVDADDRVREIVRLATGTVSRSSRRRRPTST